MARDSRSFELTTRTAAGGMNSYSRIYAVVRRIPKGRVATYGQIAVLAGLPGQARQVGYALSALPEQSTLPWHRVINATGKISLRRAGSGGVTQRLILEREGIRFDTGGRASLDRFGWQPRQRTRRGG